MRLPKRPKEESKYWGSNGVKGVKIENPPETGRKIFLSVIVMCTLITSIIGIIITLNSSKKVSRLSSPEISRSMTYDRVEEGEEAVEGTENVKFDAFFLRDLDGDGYAEGIRGTCKEIGKEDTLYMEINVQTAGVLKNAKITINGQNFYLQTSLPRDEQLKDNYIGNNTKEIELNDLSNGTQKLITGFVRSGDYTNNSTKIAAIGNDTSKYSKENNQIVLTGTYVTDEGEEIEISKTVNFTVDWYGKTSASITATTQTYQIANAIDEENQTFTTNFNVTIQETKQQLLLSKLFVEGTIPELNGYAPTEVKLTGSTDNFNYDETTRQFTIQREATIDENGVVTTSIARSNTYKLQVKYPLEAYESIGTEEISIKIPVKGYYEGYNNPNEEFNNPYKSNTAAATIVVNYRKPAESQTDFSVTVGKYVSNPTGRYMVSKQKPMNMYNGKTDKETNDTYLVTWRAYIGTSTSTESLTMKENVPDSFIKTDSTEDSMENLTTYKGIYFGNITNMLGEEGYIKVYDDETDILLETFDKTKANIYSSSKPYYYDMPVKRIRIETSATTNDTSLYVYHVKELDDEALVESYTQEEFENLQYIKSTLSGQVGDSSAIVRINQANYEAPISIATIGISKNTLSTQKTEENVKITIQTKCDESSNQVKWLNGAFLVKLPEEILDLEINGVTIDNTNVVLTSYELVEQDGCKFIKILTSNTLEASYNITIDVNITPDPRKASATKAIELYASNENVSDYYYKGEDTYDVNNNLNTIEIINKTTTNISLVSPSSLLTNQIGSEYDDKGSVIVSPEIAEIKPQVGTVDEEFTEKTAKIGIQLKNNYSSTISDVVILGKIPFEGNTYVLTGKDLGSEFTTKMVNTGIELPEEVANVAKVYYSENTNPSKDLTDESNAWKTADQVENWDNIKTFIIDLSEYVMPQGQELVFNYVIKIPNGLEYNKVSYSHHGVYFSLETAEGKYKTQTEPNRIGFKIAEKYNLELIKYQTGKDKLIPGATYKITEEGQTEGKTAITDINGTLTFENLYVEKTYLIEEIKVPTDYELNTSVIKFVGHVDGSTLTIEKLEGETREDIGVNKLEGEEYKAIVKVEDEAKARLKITKKEQDTDPVIKGVKFKITGEGLPGTGKILTTNINGEIILNGLKVSSEYILEEVAAIGYYVNTEQVKFKIVNNDGNYEVQIIEGTTRENSITEEDGIPTINMTIDNEKIPTYNLELIKIKKTLDVNVSDNEEGATSENGTEESKTEEITYLQGAKFKLYKNDKEIGEYITGEDGKVTIPNLYQYVDGKDEKATYTLKETLAPDGYAKVKDITFKVQAEDGTLKFINTNGEEEKYTVEGNTVKLTIEDSPSFKLIKKDGETGELLANVKFAIYNVDDGQVPATNSKGEIIGTKEVIDGKEYYTLTTDQNGEITADLKEGLYKAVEIQAPDKYDIENSTYYFGIGASREGKKSATAEWAKGIGGERNDRISSVVETTDGGYAVGGYFYSSSIDIGNGVTLSNKSSRKSYADGMIIKYSEEGEVEWAQGIGGSDRDYINSVAETRDGGYAVGGYFRSSSIDLGNGVTLNNSSTDYYDGMLIKYSSNGEVEWAQGIGESDYEEINSVAETSDGGYIVGGYFRSSSIDLGNGVTLKNNSSSTNNADGMIIKYSEEGEVEWAQGIGGSDSDYINSVAETRDGGYVVGGYFYSSSIDLGNGETLSNNGNSDGMIMRIVPQMSSPEVQELAVENTRKEYKITTDIQEIDGIKGGSISGENKRPYETVKYGDTNTKEIIMTPDENYEIISITVNGEEYQFVANEDGTYTMPPFENITEDKHIVVTYVLKDNKIVINKIDSKTRENLTGAKFKLDQIEEREVPESTIGELTDNGQEYENVDSTNEITNVLGSLTNNGTYYFIEENGTYVPTSSKTYQVANGGTAGKSNTTANSYIPIDLSSYTGKYVVVVNAKVSSENNYDYGYATVTKDTTAPTYNSSTGQFIKISGTSSSVTTAKDYTSMVLEGGKTYYLHLGYRKNASIDTGEDRITINSVKVYGTMTQTYNFIDNNGKYESTNQGKDNTVSNSYIPIDLTNCKGKYNIIVNANISSDSGDYGYATITETTDRPAYNSSTGRFIYISGTSESVTTPIDYTTVLEGGKLYYLHLGYYKNASTSTGDDKFTVNSVSVTLNDSELYHTEVETNSNGQAITQIPFGKYAVTEIQAPEGYEINENSIVIEFRADGNHEFTIENKKIAKVIVHHYIKGTTTKLAEDEITIGKEGENYTTAPNLDISGYTLEQDTDGNYIIPENAIGTYQSGDQEVTYYYVPQKVKLTVHHYIEGTETPVPLKDETTAEDIVTEGTKGENYTTQAINPDELAEWYSLVEVPENATGTYQDGEIVVTYYYSQRTGEVIVHHYIKDTTTKLSKDVNKIGAVGSTYETEPAIDIPEYYELVAMPDNYTGTVGEEPTEVNYYYQPKKYEYTVEYYFEGILDETLTEKLTAEYGSEISTYPDKIKPKYHFDKSENLPLIITTNPEENIIKIYYRRNSYDITTEVEGEGGSISGEEEQPYESVLAKYDSTKDIIVTPEKGYTVKEIKVNGTTTTSYTENEDGTVTLSKFTTMLEDKHVVASFRKLFTIIKQGEEETTLLPGAKFTIKDENGNNVIDRNGQTVGIPETIYGQELYVVITDEEGRIDLDLNPGKYIITEVQAPENYILPELEADRTYTIEVETAIKEETELRKNWSNIVSSDTYDDLTDEEASKIEETINEEFLNTIHCNSTTSTSDGGIIISADTNANQQITVPAEYTADGNEIIINQDENKGYQAIAVKCNSEGKIEYIKKIDSEDNQSQFTSLMYINEIDDGYIALEYEGENLEDGSYQSRILLLKLDTNLEIENKLDIDAEDAESFWDTVSNDQIKIEQIEDGSYNMLNISTGELSNYIEEVVVEAYPADAPTLTVSNELQKYEYKVEYYYDGEIDESLTETLEEKYGKTVESYTDKVKENYVLEKTENLPLTITNDQEKNVIKIYYATKAQATVQYIDKDTGEIIYEETEDGYVGKEFDTEAKDFEKYVLVEEPEEKTIEMQEETIVIKYYYVRVSSGVIEKHIDITSGEILFNTTYEGVVGTPYSTNPQEFEGYDLVQERYPENAEGQMEVDVITVTYYYIKRVTITVEYVDIDTNEKIEEEITINGHEGDEYSTEQKEIEGYEFVEVTEDKEGNMTEDKTITYYYKKVVPIPVEPEEPEQPVTPPESTPGEKGEDPTIADVIIPAAGTTKLAIVLAIIAMIIGVMDIMAYKKYKKLLRDFK